MSGHLAVPDVDVRAAAMAAFLQAPSGLAVVDRDGLVVMANPALECALGVSWGGLTGRDLPALLFTRGHDVRALVRLLGDEDPSGELVGVHAPPEGARSWWRVRCSAMDVGADLRLVVAEDVTVRHRAIASLETEQGFVTAVLETTGSLVVVLDRDGRVERFNRAAERVAGRPFADVVARLFWEVLLPPEEWPVAAAAFAQADGPALGSLENTWLRPDGGRRRVLWSNTGLWDGAGRLVYVVGIGVDVTELRDTQRRLTAERQRFAAAFAAAPIGMALIDEQERFIEVNQALVRMLGRSSGELIASSLRQVLHPDDTARPFSLPTPDHPTPAQPAVDERRLRHADGSTVWGRLALSAPLPGGDDTSHRIVQVEDVSERRRAELALRHAALHDPLTGLPNRTLLLDRLAGALERRRRHGTTVAVLFLDLDRFKSVNDSHGHAAGDEVLREVARRLSSVVRAHDTVARLGGDEFVLVCEDLGSSAAVGALARRIEDAVAAPLAVEDVEAVVTTSIGLALAGGPGTTPVDLLRDADLAMYRAKERGRDRVEVFDAELRARTLWRVTTERDLRRALDADQLRLAYQPMVDLRTGRIIGVEALLRLQHPTRGLTAPGEFMAVAEDCGLVVPIGDWVLGAAVRQAAQWHASFDRVEMAVNVSPRQLNRPGFAERVQELLHRHGVPPSLLTLELTESTLLEAGETTLRALDALVAAGLRIAIDDFGTGYSSLTYLKRFPVAVVKVDRSFVAGLDRDADDTAIVAAVVGLGHALNLVTVAEGVETPEQLAALRALGCQVGQGYLFAAPATAEVTTERLTADARG